MVAANKKNNYREEAAANSGTFRMQQVLSPLHKQRLSPRFSPLANSPSRRAAVAARLATTLAAQCADAMEEAAAVEDESRSILDFSPARSSAFMPTEDYDFSPGKYHSDVDITSGSPIHASDLNDSPYGTSPYSSRQKWCPVPSKAYKLGKGRWSYNQCELILQQQAVVQDASLTEVRVIEALHINSRVMPPACGHQVPFQLRLSNGYMISVTVSLVYEEAHLVHEISEGKVGDKQTCFLWTPVTRDECSKGCSGPTLKTLQRFGTFGRRSNGPHPTSLSLGTAGRKAKQAKYMYLSIDEAATHVGNKRFRLVAMVYEQNGQDLIGTTCSQPIRVMANNDVPIGAAHIRLSCSIRREWRGWTYIGPRLSRRCLWPSMPERGSQLDAAAPAHPAASTPLAAHLGRCNSHWGEAAAATVASEGSTPMAACESAQPPHQGLVHVSTPTRQPSAQAAIGHEPADARSGRPACSPPCFSEGGFSDGPASAVNILALTSSSSADCAWHDAMAASTRSLEWSPAAFAEGVEHLPQACCKLLPSLLVQH
ncbi:TPA: hypothetical protein ACH3X1_016529 [Trebouxia sp. C0004]